MTTSKHVFITGATGLVGSYLSREMLDAGHSVTALRRASSDLSLVADIADRMEWIEGDVLEPATMSAAIQQADWVIHSAAMISFSPETIDLMKTVNIEGTRNVVELCLMQGVEQLCFVGSTAGLGKPSDRKTVDESIDSHHAIMNTTYAQTKYASESVVWDGRQKGLDVLVINPPVVLGIGDWEKSSSRLFDYVWQQKSFYPGGIINYVDVRDLVTCTRMLMESKILNERFIVGGGHLEYGAFFRLIAGHLGVKAPSKRLSPFVAEILWRVEKVRARLTGSKAFITRENAKTTSARYIYETGKIRKALGYEFRTAEETVAWVCAGFMASQEF